MNLKFWKKSPPQQNEADDTTPGLLARMKARVGALTGRLKSPPPFQADVVDGDPAPETGTDDVSSAPKTSSRTKLMIGGALLLLLLLGAFGIAAWKIFLSSPDQDTDPFKTAAEPHAITPSLPIAMPASTPSETPVLTVASAVPETASMPASAEPPASADAQLEALNRRKAEFQAQLDNQNPDHPPAHTDKTAGEDDKVSASAVPKATAHTKPTASSALPPHSLTTVEPSAPSANTPETEIAKLRREKAELQRKLNELRNEKRQAAAASRLHGGPAPALGGAMTVPSNDPKATADTLKTAIDTMNAGTGDYQKKPEK